MALKTGKYTDEQSMICPALHGIMIKQQHLTKALQQLLPDLASMVDINSQIEKTPDHSPIRHCPACKGRTEHYGYMESDIAMIDFCPNCNWIWMDSGELEAIAKMYAKFQKVKPNLDQKYGHKPTDIVTAHMMGQITRGQLTARALLLSFIYD